MMYTVIVYEGEGLYVHWVDVTGWFVLVQFEKMWPT